MVRSWRDTRSRMNLDEARVVVHRERLLAEVRASRPESPPHPVDHSHGSDREDPR
ncbi:hypothetical protein [Micromonospora sp. NPDC051141]|uniref:hypothetical protein n=1 Tax=Micromonospora sp. NPDC051141 TaxID=3364284 RepID=UPI0037ABCC9B